MYYTHIYIYGEIPIVIAKFHVISILIRPSGKKGNLPAVPDVFVNLVHITLYKLVGGLLIPKELVCHELFFKMRIKFQNASKTKQVIKTLLCNIIISIRLL